MTSVWLPIRAVDDVSLRGRVLKFLTHPHGMMHIASINPEIYVQARKDSYFAQILRTAEAHIIDGVGFVWCARIQGCHSMKRLSGVDALTQLASIYGTTHTVVYLGGLPGTAQTLAKKYGGIAFGSVDRTDKNLIEQVRVLKPDIVFVAFGSPYQEKWIEDNRSRLDGAVCIGVGGAFDMVAGIFPRAPRWIRQCGLEWLYRLIQQPWRYKRQIRLVEFAVKSIFGVWRLV